MRTLADRIQNAHRQRAVEPEPAAVRAPARVDQRAACPWKEINNYYPFAVGAMPNTDAVPAGAAPVRRPGRVPDLPVLHRQPGDKAAAAAAGQPGQQQLLHHQLDRAVPALLLGAAQLPEPVDERRATTRSCSTGTPGRSTSAATPSGRTPTSSGPTGTAASITYRSWIHHNILGSSNWTVIEDVAGLRPRNDSQGRAVPDQHRLDPLRGQQPALPQRRPDRSSGTTRPTASTRYTRRPAGLLDLHQRHPGRHRQPAGARSSGTRPPARSPPAGGTVDLQHVGRRACRRRPRSCRPSAADGRHARQGRRRPDRRPDQPGRRARPSSASYTGVRHATGAARSTASRPTSRSGAPAARPTPGLVRGQLRHGPHGQRGAAVLQGQPPGQRHLPGAVVVPRSSTQRQHLGERRPARSRRRPRRGPTTTWCSFTGGQRAAGPGAGHQRLRRQDRPDRGQGVQPGRRPAAAARPATWRCRRRRRRRTPRRGRASPALNDGIDPPSSNDTVNPRWGTWPNTGRAVGAS